MRRKTGIGVLAAGMLIFGYGIVSTAHPVGNTALQVGDGGDGIPPMNPPPPTPAPAGMDGGGIPAEGPTEAPLR